MRMGNLPISCIANVPMIDGVTHWVRSAILRVLFVMLSLLRIYPIPIDQALAAYVLFNLLEKQPQ